jgi:hypothetical protein
MAGWRIDLRSATGKRRPEGRFFLSVKCVSALNADGFARGLKLWFFPVDINVFSIYQCAWRGMIATQAGAGS